MAVTADATGRRFVYVEVDVPGTPEEVWRAIATGDGVSSWFVPTEIEADDDGTPTRIVCNFGPGMDSSAQVTSWCPFNCFTAESDEIGTDAPLLHTEWTVTPKSNNSCVVRVMHHLYAEDDKWDHQLLGAESGWPGFFHVLQMYQTYFAGMGGASVHLMIPVSDPVTDSWHALTGALNLPAATVGERCRAPADAPPLAGVVESATGGEQLVLRLEDPMPGLAQFLVQPMGGQVCVMGRMYLYGDHAASTIERDGQAWHRWLTEHFSASA